MMRPLQSFISALLFLFVFATAVCCHSSSYAQVKFSTICPEKTIGKNDYLQIEFRVENASDIQNISPPSFSHFDIVGGPNQQSGMSNINGKIDQYISVGFYLKPKATGNFTIAAARATIHGKNYYTDPIDIKVTNASNHSSANPNGNIPLSPFSGFGLNFPAEPSIHKFDDYILKKGENVTEKVQKNLFVRLDLNKTNCFVGEPIVASYKLYTRLRSESVVTEAPSFNGFSVSDLDVNTNAVQTEKFNGREYNVYTLRKVQLYPLQPGTITLDPVVTDNDITFLRSEYAGNQKGDMFFDMLQDFANSNSPADAVIRKRVTLKSKAITVMVHPLPDSGKPADFKGAVGNFAVSSSLDRKGITTDDMGNVKIILSGEGNIHLVNALKINWPAQMEGYEAKVSDDIDKFSVPMKGNKIFTYPFTASNPGAYTIPSVSFSYFDPAAKIYKTLQTHPLEINVKKGKGYTEGTYVKKGKGGDRDRETAFQKTIPYVVGGVSLLAAFFIVATRVKKRKEKKKQDLIETPDGGLGIVANETVDEFIIPQNPLLAAHEKLLERNDAEFYRVLDSSIKKYLAVKFKVPVEEITKKRLMEELDKCNVGCSTSRMLISLLDEVELNVYAPVSNSNHLQKTYEKASEVVALLEKQVC